MSNEHPQPFFEAPPGACRIVLVRHGQSMPFREGSPFPLVDGHGDPALSPRGLWQAEQVAERLADEPIEAIYVSSLTRTHQTAAPLAGRLGIKPVVEPDLREIYLGEFEGGLIRQATAEGHPAIQKMHETGEWGHVPGAETNEALRARTVAVIARLASAHTDQMIAAVVHGGVIGALLGHATGAHQRTFIASRNGSLAYLYVTPEAWFVRSYNDASHIGPLTLDLDGHEIS
jgi:2,3-bisphosphoglycerate-dependent phosphoglycerate mutase